MHSAKIIRRLTALLVALAVCGLPVPQRGLSDDGGAQPKASPPESGDPGIGAQLLDPELKPLVPRQPRTAKDQQRIKEIEDTPRYILSPEEKLGKIYFVFMKYIDFLF